MYFFDEENAGKSGQPLFADGFYSLDRSITYVPLSWDRSLRRSFEFLSTRAIRKSGSICSICRSQIEAMGCRCGINNTEEQDHVINFAHDRYMKNRKEGK